MSTQSAKIYQLRFWKLYWITMRPYLLFVSGSTGLVGLAFVPGQERLSTLLLFAVFFFSYGFGQALTDCFQTDTDSLSSPYRPLVQGKISRTQVMAVSLGGLLMGVAVLAVFNFYILFPGILAVAGLATYTFFKRTWWGGPPWNSWIVALLVVIARMTEPGTGLSLLTQPHLAGPAFWYATGMVFFAYLNFVVMGYFKDISADRQTGYRTFPVVFGWEATAIYSDLSALFAIVCAVLALNSIPQAALGGWMFLLPAIGINLYAQFNIHRIREEHLAYKPIANVVRAFILYGLSIAGALRPAWLPGLLFFYLVFELTIKSRPMAQQV
jgi:4-hydroxybenzoate polyprenyltransferase